MSKIHKISFVVEAKITQTFTIIEEGLEYDDIKKGLQEGTYITTLDYNNLHGHEEHIVRFNEDNTYTLVAVIKSQQAEGDITAYE